MPGTLQPRDNAAGEVPKRTPPERGVSETRAPTYGFVVLSVNVSDLL